MGRVVGGDGTAGMLAFRSGGPCLDVSVRYSKGWSLRLSMSTQMVSRFLARPWFCMEVALVFSPSMQ